MKSTLNNLLDLVDSWIHSKPIAVMNVALWVLFVLIVILTGVL